MSRSPEKRNHDDSDMRSVSPSRSPIHQQEREREEPELPAKRMRMDARKEDNARGKRLFGNILGTLQKFQKDDKSSRTSEAAKRREQVSSRIAAKLRIETTLQNDIADSEKELKSLKIGTESLEYVLKHKEIAIKARHQALRPTSKFLYTHLPLPEPLIFESHLLHPAPIPLVKGPSREPPHGKQIPPLYYLPKILLSHQKDAIHTRQTNIAELISEEEAALVKEREEVAATSEKNKRRIEELQDKLVELKRQKNEHAAESNGNGNTNTNGGSRIGARGEDGEREGRESRDDFGRTPREEMKVDRSSSMPAGRRGEAEKEREGEKDRDDKEQGVLIKGDEGDIEVEY